MKNFIIYPLTALAAVLTFSSCLKKLNVKEDLFYPGKHIYACAQRQQSCAMDGANIAFRLNILLNEIKRQQEAYPEDEIDLNDVKYDGKSLSALLFGSGSLTATVNNSHYRAEIDTIPGSPDIYRISYPLYYKNSRDSWRKGVVEIRTHGKLLNELDDTGDEFWEVRNVTNETMALVSYDSGDNPEFVFVQYGDYKIYHFSGTYRVEAYYFSSWFNDQYPSEWYLNVTIKTNIPAGWDCNTIMSEHTTLEIAGRGEGESMYLVLNESYQPVQLSLTHKTGSDAPLIYKSGTECNWLYHNMNIPFLFHSCSQGVINATLHNSTLSSIYPSMDVSIEWKPYAGSCMPNAVIEYNDQTGLW